ncbi:MAG: ATP-binding protein [Anaerolineae bacterium]
MHLVADDVPGLAIRCDEQGQILDCLHDSLGLCLSARAGLSWTRLIDRGSFQKALSFLARLREEGAVFGWELNVPTSEKVLTLLFAGFVDGEQLVIVGAQTDEELRTLYKELTRINNEQLNALRATLKAQAEIAQAEIAQAEEPQEQQLYEEISRLNNELVAMQRELAKKNAQLKRLNEEKNRMLGMAAHDLRNPLHVIFSFSEFLLDEIGEALDPDLREMLSTIHRSSAFMTHLVNDLLDVAKIESGKLELHRCPTDLVALVERNVGLNRLIAAGKEITLRLSTEPLPPMSLDPEKIEQVLNNLLSNAIKYSHPRTTVHVRLRREDDHALLAVEDEGQGIPAEELERLFRPFQRTSVQSTAGERSTGLGLVIVKRIVEKHGGKIWVESRVGVGSTFFVALPYRKEGSVPHGQS